MTDSKETDSENRVTIKSPFPDNIDSFNNEESFTDLDFTIPGMEAPLHLHKLILAKASVMLDSLLKTKKESVWCL